VLNECVHFFARSLVEVGVQVESFNT